MSDITLGTLMLLLVVVFAIIMEESRFGLFVYGEGDFAPGTLAQDDVRERMLLVRF